MTLVYVFTTMVVTRFAPSPTGSMHIGGIRTALFDYALAKHENGKFLLRIEDTDQKRFVEGAEKDIEDMLLEYGLPYDEKSKQSERLPIYKEYAEKLIASGDAYYCFSTVEEIAELRKKANEEKKNFVFRSPFRDLPLEEAKKKIENGEKYVIRQKLPENHVVVFDDGVQGTVSFNTNDVDESVLLKSNGFPSYHLAVVVDDTLMNVTHVFRGVEWLSSVPKHVLIYKALGIQMPVISHLPLILDPDGGKLSKRKGSVSARGFIVEGYLPEAMLNFLMLLGWASPEKFEHGEKETEIFSLQDFVDKFSITDINKHSPVFNREKLLWFNHKYIQALSPDNLTNKFLYWLKTFAEESDLKEAIIEKGPDFLQAALLLEQERIHIWSDLLLALRPFYFHSGKFSLTDSKQTKKLSNEDVQKLLVTIIEFLDKEDLLAMDHEKWEMFIRDYSEKNNQKAGAFFMCLRLALLETPFSPPLFDVMKILGKDEVINRFKKYIQ